ncbi:Carbon monoxide dehydrogenase large chain [Luteitalea pratensis]|uniref:Carbon monoxide dehydrogenase large chain n=1 Tax=Luteitalea pratensis TaxID=1855912 RepID=A0A143PSW7_LUTPR|nr:xanthine dehydrogenase family protein molybdopterin-binding subunit [Luteitalea pratensis]AMY11253.1 Carbon monoxide dehydrogenase large chain [Luteitalea pratensis]
MASTPVLPKLVGERVRRREDPRLIQGRGTYVDDVKIVGMQHLAFKRSDVAHGRILSIDVSAAEAMDGVEAVFTGAQIAEMLAPMPIATPFPSPPHRAVAVDVVRFAGEPVAVVVARDRYVARDAADAIVVDIDPLPAVVDPELAMTGQPTVIHPDFPNNLAVALVPSGTGCTPDGKVDDTAVDRAFAEAEIVVSQRMMNQRLVPNAIEPRGVVANFEPGKGSMTIWSSTQNPHILRTMIAAMTGLGQDQVRAIAPEVGGGFGAKINIYGEEYVTAAISKRLGIPVKWIEDRSEAFVATTHGRDIIGYVDVAALRTGKVLGLKMRLIADIGAYNMLLTAAIPTLTMMMANGTYAIPAIRTTLTEVFTNKTPTDAYRGAGRPEATYFVERAMDMLARELKMDPAELRRRNFIAADQFPYATQMGAVYDSGDYGKALDCALDASNWKALIAERDAARKEGRLVGVGLAMYVEVCGLGPSSSLPTGGWEHSQVTIERDGRISATTGASPHGQGNETTFAQMLADQFGVPIEHITIHHGDTSVVKQGIGTFGSRSQAVGGTAMHLAGGKVKSKMAKFAAALLEAHEDDLVFENGRIGVKGSPASAKSFAEVAGYAYVPVPLPPGLEPGLSDEAFFEPTNNTYPFGCVIAMLEIDRETGEPTLRRLVAADDAGNLINPLIVEGQIHGGLAQGIGQAMVEEAVYNDDGQLLTGSFMDYALPRATDFPRFELHATVTPTPVNPLGAKGVGEAGTLGSTPCIVNAAVDALSEFGVTHIDMMLRPEKLWRIIHGGQA